MPLQPSVNEARKAKALIKNIKVGIAETGLSSAAQWRANPTRISTGHTLGTLYSKAGTTKRNGEGHLGHKYWHIMLEKEIGITPIDHQPWSDERFHSSVAALAEKHPVKKANWRNSNEPIFYNRSLQSFYTIASRSNAAQGKKRPWFNFPSFEAYAKWAVKNYGGDYAERKWQEAIEKEKAEKK